MKKLNMNSLALGVALAVASTGAFAGTIAGTSAAVGVEAATTGSLVAAGGVFEIVPAVGTNASDRITVTLSDGATFADGSYTLFTSDGADIGNTAFTTVTNPVAGASSIVFRSASTVSTTAEYVLSSSSAIAGVGAGFTVTLPSLAAGNSVNLSASMSDLGGVYDIYPGVEIFEYANQFSGAVSDLADETIDVNTNRLTFLNDGSSDDIALELTDAAVANGVTLNDNDEVDFVLSGDMSGLVSVALITTEANGANAVERGEFVVADDNASATFSASASDVFGTASSVIRATVDGETALTTRTFTVKADLNFETETDKNLVAEGTPAGLWNINGLQAKVAHLTLNSSGFVSWLKVANEGTTSAQINADIIYTLADGTEGSVDNAALGTVDAGGVFTVSEASILEAMGNPEGIVDASLTVTVAGQTNLIHLIAEKKASDGRVSLPVYYNISGANPRNWVQ